MNWHVGDMAIIAGLVVDTTWNGAVVTVLSELRPAKLDGRPVHEVDVEPPEGMRFSVISPKFLIPIDDDASWDEIERSTGWKPKVLETISE